MKLFKNFKTKRQLREEIAMLKGMLTPTIHTVERDVETVRSCVLLEENMPVEFAKEMIARRMADFLKPLIDYDVEDSPTDDSLGKKLTGTLYVAKKK